MRVVIDTNIWISYLIGNLLQEIDEKIVSKEIKIVVSEGLLKELSEVFKRPKFQNIFTPKRIKELFSLLDSYAVVIVPRQKINICRDAKDNFLLEIAVEGNADYLITGDEDLLVLNPFHNIKIVSSKDFEGVLKRKR
ncbi:MAG: putative toxin-antitoxin system toxin component, PIN family [Thermodesulfovibrionales bacterium]|nr:putative toxin-antitoxin system toxin component, PIN family [Thermodesulfovibrionales bacterium]